MEVLDLNLDNLEFSEDETPEDKQNESKSQKPIIPIKPTKPKSPHKDAVIPQRPLDPEDIDEIEDLKLEPDTDMKKLLNHKEDRRRLNEKLESDPEFRKEFIQEQKKRTETSRSAPIPDLSMIPDEILKEKTSLDEIEPDGLARYGIYIKKKKKMVIHIHQ